MRGIHSDHSVAATGHGETGDPLALRPAGPADRILARAFSASLDGQLAAGAPPESSRLLATRAREIVRLTRRQALARHWEHLLRVATAGATGQATATRAVLAIDSGQITAAAPAIRQLANSLITPLPVAARGVAMAIVLLTDATGPVYNSRGRETLAAALAAAIEQLDPARPVFTAPCTPPPAGLRP